MSGFTFDALLPDAATACTLDVFHIRPVPFHLSLLATYASIPWISRPMSFCHNQIGHVIDWTVHYHHLQYPYTLKLICDF